jgi:hypothetical protein
MLIEEDSNLKAPAAPDEAEAGAPHAANSFFDTVAHHNWIGMGPDKLKAWLRRRDESADSVSQVHAG